MTLCSLPSGLWISEAMSGLYVGIGFLGDRARDRSDDGALHSGGPTGDARGH
jgi:hypothetical protein